MMFFFIAKLWAQASYWRWTSNSRWMESLLFVSYLWGSFPATNQWHEIDDGFMIDHGQLFATFSLALWQKSNVMDYHIPHSEKLDNPPCITMPSIMNHDPHLISSFHRDENRLVSLYIKPAARYSYPVSKSIPAWKGRVWIENCVPTWVWVKHGYGEGISHLSNSTFPNLGLETSCCGRRWPLPGRCGRAMRTNLVPSHGGAAGFNHGGCRWPAPDLLSPPSLATPSCAAARVHRSRLAGSSLTVLPCGCSAGGQLTRATRPCLRMPLAAGRLGLQFRLQQLCSMLPSCCVFWLSFFWLLKVL